MARPVPHPGPGPRGRGARGVADAGGTGPEVGERVRRRGAVPGAVGEDRAGTRHVLLEVRVVGPEVVVRPVHDAGAEHVGGGAGGPGVVHPGLVGVLVVVVVRRVVEGADGDLVMARNGGLRAGALPGEEDDRGAHALLRRGQVLGAVVDRRALAVRSDHVVQGVDVPVEQVTEGRDVGRGRQVLLHARALGELTRHLLRADREQRRVEPARELVDDLLALGDRLLAGHVDDPVRREMGVRMGPRARAGARAEADAERLADHRGVAGQFETWHQLHVMTRGEGLQVLDVGAAVAVVGVGEPGEPRAVQAEALGLRQMQEQGVQLLVAHPADQVLQVRDPPVLAPRVQMHHADRLRGPVDRAGARDGAVVGRGGAQELEEGAGAVVQAVRGGGGDADGAGAVEAVALGPRLGGGAPVGGEGEDDVVPVRPPARDDTWGDAGDLLDLRTQLTREGADGLACGAGEFGAAGRQRGGRRLPRVDQDAGAAGEFGAPRERGPVGGAGDDGRHAVVRPGSVCPVAGAS